MKMFFASQFFIASLLMIWNATKKGVWENLPFRKSPSEKVAKVSKASDFHSQDIAISFLPERSLSTKELPLPHEIDTIYLAKNELPHFDDDINSIIPSLGRTDGLLVGNVHEPTEISTVAFNNEAVPLVSSFTTHVLNQEWDVTGNEMHTGSLPILGRQAIEKSELLPSSPILQPDVKNPLIAAGLSLVPGLGHAYLGDRQTAGGLIGSAAVGHSLFLSQYYNDSFYDESLYLSSLTFAQTTEFYGIYAAYRDARQRIGMSGYTYKMPTDSLLSLARAPFDLQILKKPEVWGGIVGALGLAIGTIWIAYPSEARIHAKASTSTAMPILALPIGIGEETFFRGFLQSELSEHLTPLGGIAVSSLAFGAAHIPNAFTIDRSMRWRYYAFNIPLITGLGAYFGYLTHKSGSLKESVAVHTWYDFILMASDALISYSASTGRPGFATSIPF